MLDLLTVQLPASAEGVEVWAGQVSVQLVSPVHGLGDTTVPTAAWQARMATRWPTLDLSRPVLTWLQVLAYAWASEPAGIHGSVERALVHGWSRVPPHSWPADWPVSALEMALEMGWQTLPDTLLRHRRSGWPQPKLTAALRKRLGVSPTQFEALKALMPEEGTQALWRRAGQAASVADIEALQGQSVRVPPDAEPGSDDVPSWPEWNWTTTAVKEWPAMHAALGHVRATDPRAQAQQGPAGRALLVRALALGQVGVARALGWDAWVASAEPLVYQTGPDPGTARSLLDGLAQGQRLSHPDHLGTWLDHVFQAAQQAGRPADWCRPDDPARDRSPALRFWGRALGSSFHALKDPVAYPGRRRVPAWWRFLMQERGEVWQAWWQALAPSAAERWHLWWQAVHRRTAALNPWHLLAAVRLPAARALLGGGSPWATLATIEAQWVTQCLDRWMYDATADAERWRQADVRWAMLSVADRWRRTIAGQADPLWLPVIWAWLSALDMADPDDQAQAQRLARPWWQRLTTWAQAHPEQAQQASLKHEHQWSLVGCPATEAHWRAPLAQLNAPEAATPARARRRS